MEARTLFSSGANLGEVVQPVAPKGSLAPGGTDIYIIHLAHPGWIDASTFRVTNSNYELLLSISGDNVDVPGKNSSPGGQHIGMIESASPENRLPAGDYKVQVVRHDLPSSNPNVKPLQSITYQLALLVDYAGKTGALALDAGDLKNTRTDVGFVGTFPSVVTNGSNIYKYTMAHPGQIEASVGNASGAGVRIYRLVNGQYEAPVGYFRKTTAEVPAGTFYIEVHALTGQANYALTVTAMPTSITPSFSWSMAPRYGIDSNKNGVIDLPNSAAYANPLAFEVDLDASDSASRTAIAKTVWTVSGGGLKSPVKLSGVNTKFFAPNQGTYNVILTLTDKGGLSTSTEQTIRVKDYLIVSVGDSYASGEGNPEVPSSKPSKVKWADGLSSSMTLENFEAHRSSAAASSVAAMKLERSDPHTSVTYINLAESGAEMTEGMLQPMEGRTDASYKLKGEIPELRTIVGSRKIDALTLSVGGNDFGFEKFIGQLIIRDGVALPTEASMQTNAATALAEMSQNFQAVAAALETFSIGQTMMTAYPDMTRDGTGLPARFATDVLPTSGLLGISAASANFASNVLLAELNGFVASAAGNAGYAYVDDYRSAFLPHGYPSSSPWFVTESKARATQGSETSEFSVPISRGGFHPNVFGLKVIGDSLYDQIASDPAAS